MKDTYVHLNVGELTDAQKKKFMKTNKVTFTLDQLKSTSHHIALHPSNVVKFKKAQAAGKGVTLAFTVPKV